MIVISKELVQDGTGVNYRPLKVLYVEEDRAWSEVYTYIFPADSPEWMAVNTVTKIEEEVNDLPTFRTWDISTDPITGEDRKIHLVNLTVTKDAVKALFLIEYPETERPSKLSLKVGDNSDTFTLPDNTEMGERDYWEYLTVEQEMTPYQLLDFRVPQIDMEGGWNG